MNKIVNNLLLGGHMFMPEMHLRKPGFTYSACGAFTKHRERIQKFRETSNLKHLYRNESDKACFTLDAEYFDRKDLAKRTILGKILKVRADKIAINPYYDGHQKELASIFYKSFAEKKQGQEQV